MIDLKYIRYDILFFSDIRLQQFLDSAEVRSQFKAWCIILNEKLKRNGI